MTNQPTARGPHPPERVVVNDRLVLRRPTLEDVPLLSRVATSCLGHLARFMPWANTTGVSVEAQTKRLVHELDPGWEYQGTNVFDNKFAFDYLMWNGDESQVIGGGGLMTRDGRPRLEIGLWVAESATRQGIGTAFAQALIPLAFEFPEVDEVLWVNDVANKASARIPDKLGFEISEIAESEPHGNQGTGFVQRWLLTRDDARKRNYIKSR